MLPTELGQARALLKSLDAGQHNRIAVIGDLALDKYIQGSVDRISPEAPVPVLLVEKKFSRLGCAANVVANLATFCSHWSFEVDVFGILGKDDSGNELKKCLSSLSKKIHLNLIEDSKRPTTVKTRYLASNQQLLRVDEESQEPLHEELANQLLESILSKISQYSCVLIQDYAKGTLSKDFLQKLLKVAREKNIPTYIDPNKNTPFDFYSGATLITPNISEAEKLLNYSLKNGADESLVSKACHDLKQKLSLDMCLITRSAYGMSLLDRAEQMTHFPSSAREVYDVTGAGDTVVAMLGGATAAGASIQTACLLASAAAGVVVGKIGTSTASVSEIELELERMLP